MTKLTEQQKIQLDKMYKKVMEQYKKALIELQNA